MNLITIWLFSTFITVVYLKSDEDKLNNSTNNTNDAPPGINPNASVELDHKCKEPVEIGNGSIPMKRFFFDTETSSCSEFEYSGDGGNSNNFESELDCLNDCYTGVSEGIPVNEEDVVFIGRKISSENSLKNVLPVANPSCLLPKDSGNCTDSIQSFYFLSEWQSCIAFKYSGCGGNDNQFASRIECEQSCLVVDGSVCRGPSGPSELLKKGPDCNTSICPLDTVCAMGMRSPECCKFDEHDLLQQAYSPKCKNGAQAGGHFGEYFVATFAKTCDDLICMPGEQCIIHRKSEMTFAKCCQQRDKPPKLAIKIMEKIFHEKRV